MIHGRAADAERVVLGIESEFRARGHSLPPAVLPVIRLRARRFTPLREVARTLFGSARTRTFVGLSLMASQAFFYNAIFFTYALVLTDFYGVRATMSAGISYRSQPGIFSGPSFSAACSTPSAGVR